MKILVTGGTGYIGSHTLVELIQAGHDPVAVDNLSNSSRESLDRVKQITGYEVPFYQADIRDEKEMNRACAEHAFDCCIHFAGLKAVGESSEKPWEYYDNNVHGTLVLLNALRGNGCRNLIFSSSATVYGEPDIMPITEEFPSGTCTNPYGRTKSMIEDILRDIHAAGQQQSRADGRNTDMWNVVILRYFNPVGAHPSGLMGEDPKGIPNNLMPYVSQVAAGRRQQLTVFGNDYDTRDGTGVRDYIHVVDLARGHVAALADVEKKRGLSIYNLGTGTGYSVLDMVKTFSEVNGVDVPYVIGPRRAGDIAECYSDPSKAYRQLGWKAEYGLEEMCRDSWNWQKNNPDGYSHG